MTELKKKIKKWDRPKLIVLMKGSPTEGLLNSCKGYDWSNNPKKGPGNNNSYSCDYNSWGCAACSTKLRS